MLRINNYFVSEREMLHDKIKNMPEDNCINDFFDYIRDSSVSTSRLEKELIRELRDNRFSLVKTLTMLMPVEEFNEVMWNHLQLGGDALDIMSYEQLNRFTNKVCSNKDARKHISEFMNKYYIEVLTRYNGTERK